MRACAADYVSIDEWVKQRRDQPAPQSGARKVDTFRQEHGISELVSSVPEGVRLAFHLRQHLVTLKRPQHVVVAGPPLVRAGHDRIHAAQWREWADTLCGGSRARTNGAVRARRV